MSVETIPTEVAVSREQTRGHGRAQGAEAPQTYTQYKTIWANLRA